MKLLCTLTLALVALAVSPVGRAAEAVFPGNSIPVSTLLSAIAEKAPRSLKPVGTTALVFKMDLEGPIDAAWKPRSKRHPFGDRAEVAAFRIGRALGLDNVVPAVPRALALETVRSLLEKQEPGRYASVEPELIIENEQIAGAAIYWIPDMHELGLDTKEGMARWRKWLSQDGELPTRDKYLSVAADVSTMVCFDYLIGNWDRFSGANAQGDHDEKRVFVRDHNVAFFEPFPKPLHERVLSRLKNVQRFSRSFVTALKALDADALARALKADTDPPGYEPLDAARVEAVLDRRRALLSYIAANLDHYGEAAVLTFP